MITVLQENLARAITVAGRLARKDTFPELSCLRLKIETANSLSVTGANRNCGIVLKLSAKVEDDLDVLVPAQVLVDLMKMMEAGQPVKLSLAQQGTQLVMEHLRARSRIAVLGETTVYHTPLVIADVATTFTISAETLREVIPQVAFAAATDEARPMLTCAKLAVEADRRAQLITADGFHLTRREFLVDALSGNPLACLIPAQTLRDIIWLLSLESENDTATISFLPGQKFVVSYGDALLWGIGQWGVEGYPDVSRVIPVQPLAQARVAQRELLRGLKVVGVYSREASCAAAMQFRPGNLFALYAHSAEIGDGHLALDCRTEGDAGEVWVDVRRFMLAVQQMPVGDLDILYHGPQHPVLLRPKMENSHSPTYVYVLMPLSMKTGAQPPEPSHAPAPVAAPSDPRTIVDAELLALAVQSYSGGKIAEAGKIKKPFASNGQFYICVSMLGGGEDAARATCRRVVRADQYTGLTHTDGDQDYTGRLVQNGKTSYVLTGEELMIQREAEAA